MDITKPWIIGRPAFLLNANQLPAVLTATNLEQQSLYLLNEDPARSTEYGISI